MCAKKRKKKWLLIPAALTAAAAVGAGAWFAMQGSAEPVNVFPFMYVGMTEYWGDNQESYGPVSADNFQTVFLSDTQTVTEIKVKTGDQIKKGDILMTFDTTLDALAVERKGVELEKMKLEWKDTIHELEKVKDMEPMYIPEYYPEAEKPDLGDRVEFTGEPLRTVFPEETSTKTEFDGSSPEKALICWLPEGSVFSEKMLKTVWEQEIKRQNPDVENDESGEEIPDDGTTGDDTTGDDTTGDDTTGDDTTGDDTTGDDTTGDDTTGDDTTGDDTIGDDTTGDDTIGDDTTGDDTTGDDTTGDDTTGDDTTGGDTTGDDTTGNDTTSGDDSTDGDTASDDITDSDTTEDVTTGDEFAGGEATGSDTLNNTLENREIDNEPLIHEKDKKEEQQRQQDIVFQQTSASAFPASLLETNKADTVCVVFKITEDNMSKGTLLLWQGIRITRKTGNQYVFSFFDATGMADYSVKLDDKEEPENPDIYFGDGYTKQQLAEMRKDLEKKIREQEFNIRMAEAEYKLMQWEISDGNVYAETDGEIVSVLTEEEARTQRQPLIKLSGGGGFFVEGSVSELEKDKLQPGQEVTINDWNTGNTYTGEVREIGDFPTSNEGWNGMGNPNASYYPFQVFIDGEADLQAGSYVSVMYSTSGAEHGIYLENPFIRSEKGEYYVLVMGSDGKIEKRTVTVGKSLWGTYQEILSGVTEEDLIAFPYGKHVKPGAPAVESDISALYGY